MEMTCASWNNTWKHAEDQEDVIFGEVCVLFQNRDVQQAQNLFPVVGAASECLEKVGAFTLFPRSWEVDDALQSELPFFHRSPFENRADELVSDPELIRNL